LRVLSKLQLHQNNNNNNNNKIIIIKHFKLRASKSQDNKCGKQEVGTRNEEFVMSVNGGRG
jgi:hypothetical protein